MPRRLPWPSSRIERDVFQSLRLIAQDQRRPVSTLVAQAIAAYVNVAEAAAVQPRSGHVPARR
jgi:predicted transcriptional regulator